MQNCEQNQTKPLEEQRPRLNTFISTQKVLELHHFPAEVHHGLFLTSDSGRAPAGGLGGG